jgi:hypothetical protein
MMVFAIRIEHTLDVTVHGSHDADAREHRWAVTAIRKTDCISGDAGDAQSRSADGAGERGRLAAPAPRPARHFTMPC